MVVLFSFYLLVELSKSAIWLSIEIFISMDHLKKIGKVNVRYYINIGYTSPEFLGDQ